VTRRRGLGASEQGSTLTEFGMSIPVILLVIYAFTEICLAIYSSDLCSELARVGTRYAMFHGSSCPTSSNPTCEATASQVNTYVSTWYAAGSSQKVLNLACRSITVNTTYAAAGSNSFAATNSEAPGGQVQVTVTCAFPITLPFVPPNGLSLTSSSVMTIMQ
jgi:Flp pilus assembly protein TadG